MITKISLEQYLKMGGNLNKIDLSKTFSEYSDRNQMQAIVSIDDRGDMNKDNTVKLVYFTFANGNTHRYALSWIYTQVDLTLDKRYI